MIAHSKKLHNSNQSNLNIDETSLIPVLVASIKEQQAEIEKLKTEMHELKKTSGYSSNKIIPIENLDWCTGLKP